MGSLFSPPSIPAPPPPPPPTPMIDETTVKNARKRELTKAQSERKGRVSTILSEAGEKGLAE